jgi:hypothetical protein
MARNSKRIAIAAATMVALVSLSTAASAGQYPSHSGHGHGNSHVHGQVYDQNDWRHSGGYGNPGHYLPPQDGWDDRGRPHRPGHWRRGVCEPHEAVEKAREFGLRRIGIERVSRHEIVVSGRNYGHRALLVFDRFSRHCRVIATRGL